MNEDNKGLRLIKPKPRSKKLSPRIDLAAMVSVSFLLIIFFMVAKELAKPQAMELGMPERCFGEYDGCRGWGCGTFSRTLTLLLDGNNKIISYRGLIEVPDEAPKKLGYGRTGIRKELMKVNTQVRQYLSTRSYNKRDSGVIVMIKPSKDCSYGNLVDILDEMAIAKIPTSSIVNDFSPEERKLLASK